MEKVEEGGKEEMKIISSIKFEIKMTSEEVEAYKALSEEKREKRIEEMKGELSEIISSECVVEPNFTEFTIEIQEGE